MLAISLGVILRGLLLLSSFLVAYADFLRGLVGEHHSLDEPECVLLEPIASLTAFLLAVRTGPRHQPRKLLDHRRRERLLLLDFHRGIRHVRASACHVSF